MGCALDGISKEELAAMYFDSFMNYRDIATAIGCSVGAVCNRMKLYGFTARKIHDYPPTEKQKDAWKKNGERLGNNPNYREARRLCGMSNKGRRLRNDYEFGGHEKERADGYIAVYAPDHPCASSCGYVMKHRLVMERNLGRYLNADEVVHHINHDRKDNRIENLAVMTQSEHMRLHMIERIEQRKEKNNE